MKRRGAAAMTCLGGNSETLIDGKFTGNKKRDLLISKCAEDCYLTFFKGSKLDEDYCDAQVRDHEVRVGIEPTYQYESLKMIAISSEKNNSYIETGYSWEGWGTGIRRTRKYYCEYKNKSKFVKFVDKWHLKIFKTK